MAYSVINLFLFKANWSWESNLLFNNLLQTTFNHFIIFAAGHATESFTDFVVGHGELWSAQMLAAVVRKVQQLYALCY